MFWIQDIKAIYILYFDGTWQFLEDTWTEGTPDDSCPTLSVQSGLIKPRRGFGKVWCEQAGARARLGAATANEVGPYSVPLQRFERGLVFSRDTGQVLVLTADGVWR